MSWKASAHVLHLAERTTAEELSPTDLLVLMALAARHHQDYRCAFAQLARLSADTHLGLTALSECINRLEARGIVTIWIGPLPAMRDAPSDGRRRRGLMFCFVGLDPEDRPNVADAEPRKRLGGRPKSVPPNETYLKEWVSAEEEISSASRVNSVSPPELALLKPALNPAAALQAAEPARAGARAPDEAPPRRAADEEPAGGVPPAWEEIWPGQFLGTPQGSGEVTLLKARCPLCEQAVSPAELAEGEHHCQAVIIGPSVHPGPAHPGNLGSFLPRRRRGQAVPPEVEAELAAIAAARESTGPPAVDEDLLREHERFLARARQRQTGSSPDGGVRT